MGALLILGLTALTATIFLLEDIKMALTDTYTIVGVFDELPELPSRAPVWIAGRPAGEVVGIALMPHDADSGKHLAVTLRIRSEHASLIRRDSELTLAAPRITSDGVINIMPGTPGSPQLLPGDTLIAPARWELRRSIAHVAAVQAGLDSLRVDATLLAARARLRSPDFETMLRALGSAGRELDAFLTAYREGPLAAHLSDPELRAALARTRAAADEITTLAHARLEQARDPELAAALERLGQRGAALREQIGELQTLLAEPRGFLTRWQQDPALRDALVGVRAQLDSLIAEARARPWRFVF